MLAYSSLVPMDQLFREDMRPLTFVFSSIVLKHCSTDFGAASQHFHWVALLSLVNSICKVSKQY